VVSMGLLQLGPTILRTIISAVGFSRHADQAANQTKIITRTPGTTC
jgi:hypothetical protein